MIDVEIERTPVLRNFETISNCVQNGLESDFWVGPQTRNQLQKSKHYLNIRLKVLKAFLYPSRMFWKICF